MKFQVKPIEVEAVQYKKDMGMEDGFAVYETEYPEDGHTFEVAENIDTTRMTIIQAAIRTPIWQVVSEGDWIVTLPSGEKEIWKDEAFQERFINVQDTIRPQVDWFAKKMEETLKANDHKGGWDKCEYDYLIGRLEEEVEELRELEGDPDVRPDRIIRECTDIANFAMMIADRCR